MSSVTVVDSEVAVPSAELAEGLSVRPTLGSLTGFPALEQALIECAPGHSGTVSAGASELILFCVAGSGEADLDGEVHELEPDVGIALPPGSQCTVRNDGGATLRLVSVTVPDPEPGEAAAAPTLSRASDGELRSATTEREFRIIADPDSGLRSATHFVGYVPTVRAPDHFHHYDEVIYVLEGEGVMRAGEVSAPVFPGACIQLPARTVHCLENTGTDSMRLVAVFRPAGSPAAAFYPDGTPAYQTPADPTPVPDPARPDQHHTPEEESPR